MPSATENPAHAAISNENSHPKYRPDIDGLRAIAVLPVVGFHAFPAWISGGFIGVDVFFVISGFLISSIIYKGLDTGTFSFVDFYARRIKRIFPAFLLVLIACYAFGWFSLLADEYKQLGKHIAAGAGFISNLVLWSEAGYFDTSGETKPLLHLWSLGIEEQFYIVWPLLLWFSWKRKYNLLTLSIALALASFLLNLEGVKHDPVASFYSPLTRFWELLCGSLLAWVNLYKATAYQVTWLKIDDWLIKAIYREKVENDGHTLANILAFLGLLLLAYGFWCIDKDFSFPGNWAVIPVVAAILIIMAGPDAWPNRKLLSNKIAVWFGLISFPLYLWHWPLLSFARIIESDVPSRTIRIAAVMLSIGVAWLTYRLVEQPIRFGKVSSAAKVSVLAFLMAAVGYTGYNAYERDGLQFRRVIKINSNADSGIDGGDGSAMINECPVSPETVKRLFAHCAEDKRGNIRFALLGDSKAAALYTGLVRTSHQNGRWLFIGGNGANGAPVPYLEYDEDPKRRLTVEAVKAISEDPRIETVVLATAIRAIFGLSDGVIGGNVNTYDYTYLKTLRSTEKFDATYLGLSKVIEKFISSGKEVVIVIDNPALPNPQDCLNRTTASEAINRFLGGSNENCYLPLSEYNDDIELYRSLLAKVQAAHPESVRIFDPTDIYCAESMCSAIKNGRLMYSYTDHISDYASGIVGRRLNDFLIKH